MKDKAKIERYIIEEVKFAYENRPLPDNRFFIKVIRHSNISIEVTDATLGNIYVYFYSYIFSFMQKIYINFWWFTK